jgi:hypothetical protein
LSPRPVTVGASRARRRSLAAAAYAASFLLAPVTGVLTSDLFSRPVESLSAILLITTALVLILVIQILLALVAESFLVPSCRDVCERDPRAPVLFLRPFDEDKPLTYDVISAGETVMTNMAKAEDFLLALNAVGPLISVAAPDWSARLGLHPHGAFRDYVDPGQWQQRVEELLDQASTVVLAVGTHRASSGRSLRFASGSDRSRSSSTCRQGRPLPLPKKAAAARSRPSMSSSRQ